MLFFAPLRLCVENRNMFATARRKQLVLGLVFLAVLLGLFLWFNRIPKLDVVEADLAGVTAPNVECFQGFCLESEPDSTLFSRWWDFSLAYLKLISLGMVFAFLIAGLTETFLLPRGSIPVVWTRPGLRGSFGGMLVGPAMNLCSACIVPVANAFRQRGAGAEATLAIVHSSSTMNVPALLMAALVFTPMLAGSRIGISLLAALFLGPLVAWLAGRARGDDTPAVMPPELPAVDGGPDESTWRAVLSDGLKAWARASLRYFVRLAPVMVLAGFASALAIQWVNPDTVGAYLGNNAQGIAIAATLGVLINVPLMFEIPLVAALLLVGMGEAPAATLLFAAAAGGPVTFWGLARAMPRRAVAALVAATWGLAAVAGFGILAVAPLVGGEGAGIRASVAGVSASESSRDTGEFRIDRLEPSVVSTGGDVLVTVLRRRLRGRRGRDPERRGGGLGLARPGPAGSLGPGPRRGRGGRGGHQPRRLIRVPARRADLRAAGVRGSRRADRSGLHPLPQHPGHHPPERRAWWSSTTTATAGRTPTCRPRPTSPAWLPRVTTGTRCSATTATEPLPTWRRRPE